ncbi:MAG: radical SAM protein [Thermofilaceae archaeon]
MCPTGHVEQSGEGYDPVELVEGLRRVVCHGLKRKYYRFRGGRWYGGIATADCIGCNLRCVFCWGWSARDAPGEVGRFYSPKEVFENLKRIAERRGYSRVRISGNEPTLYWEHLLKVIELIDEAKLMFILETNGILIGGNKSYARDLSEFSSVHVRVSIKGTSSEEFHLLTGAKPEAFELQLKALENLLDYGVSAHPAVMLSFSKARDVERLKERLADIDEVLISEFEEEYVFLYPHVVRQLRKAGVWPKVAYYPENIPEELV